MATRVRSYAKINLGLAVGPPRADGFHGLTTVYQTLALHDFVTVEARAAAQTAIRLTADHRGVPRDPRNTAWKMVEGALTRLGLTAEVSIDIRKRLPVQGGMGAGSANAVAALLGLERELGVALPAEDRLELAASVGSDVPLFLLGGTVLGLGRGEEVFPLPDLPPTHCVVAVPSVGVSTGLAFRELDKRTASATGANPYADSTPVQLPAVSPTADTPGLTFQQPPDRLRKLSRVLAGVWTTSGAEPGLSGVNRRTVDLAENPLLALVRTGIENDFEEVAFSQHPSLRSTKRDLMGSPTNGGALFACLSGSGSALFGLYESQADARAAQLRVQQSGTQALLTETLPRKDYWARMYQP